MARNVLTVAAMVAAGTAMADPYALTMGDRLAISLVGAEQTYEIEVDIDGQIRFVDVGGIVVAGLTLDATEAVIEDAIEAAGLFVDPQATISITRYAPIVVAGEVVNPGRYDYLPQMTVATAMGLSGGSQFTGISRFEVERARADVTGQLRNLNLEIAATVADIARFDAELDEAGTVVVLPEQRAVIPRPDAARLDVFVADAAEIVANADARRETLLALWEEEIADLVRQDGLLAQRIAVQTQLADGMADDLEDARELQSRGLQTAQQLSRTEMMEAEARSRVLELENLRIAIQRNASDARRGREQFLRAKREDALRGRAEARVRLDDLLLRYARNLEQEAILSGGTLAGLLTSDLVEARYTLVSPRPDRAALSPVTAATVLLPGDTLIVDVGSAGTDIDKLDIGDGAVTLGLVSD